MRKKKAFLSMLEDLSHHDMEGHTIAPNWYRFHALVEVSCVAIEEFHKFQRLVQERALKNPILVQGNTLKNPVFVQEKVIGSAFPAKVRGNNGRRKRERFGTDGDDQDWGSGLEAKKKKNMIPIKKLIPGQNPHFYLPKEFWDVIKSMDGRDELLVIQKSLFKTDLTEGNSRLSIPLRQIVRMDFLTKEEKEEPRAGQEIPARLIDPKLKIGDLVLKQWDMPKDTVNTTSSTYALRTYWNKGLESNKFKIGDLLQVWSFRVGEQASDASSSGINEGQLCFALVMVGRAKSDKTNT
uniref:B3 domain-containing protein n=1 Tax=Quercus lobata TaxID=97700 RepID=A0A7N2L7W7_QUELO